MLDKTHTPDTTETRLYEGWESPAPSPATPRATPPRSPS